MRSLEQAHQSTRDDHVHRIEGLGAQRSIITAVGISRAETKGKNFNQRDELHDDMTAFLEQLITFIVSGVRSKITLKKMLLPH